MSVSVGMRVLVDAKAAALEAQRAAEERMSIIDATERDMGEFKPGRMDLIQTLQIEFGGARVPIPILTVELGR